MSDQADRITDRLRTIVSRVTADVAYELVLVLSDVNPKDTTHSARNWIANVGSRSSSVSGSREAPSGAEQGAGLKALETYDIGDGNIHVTNNVWYMEKLARGWSSQAAAGWIESSIARVIEHADMIYARWASVTEGRR